MDPRRRDLTESSPYSLSCQVRTRSILFRSLHHYFSLVCSYFHHWLQQLQPQSRVTASWLHTCRWLYFGTDGIFEESGQRHLFMDMFLCFRTLVFKSVFCMSHSSFEDWIIPHLVSLVSVFPHPHPVNSPLIRSQNLGQQKASGSTAHTLRLKSYPVSVWLLRISVRFFWLQIPLESVA